MHTPIVYAYAQSPCFSGEPRLTEGAPGQVSTEGWPWIVSLYCWVATLCRPRWGSLGSVTWGEGERPGPRLTLPGLWTLETLLNNSRFQVLHLNVGIGRKRKTNTVRLHLYMEYKKKTKTNEYAEQNSSRPHSYREQADACQRGQGVGNGDTEKRKKRLSHPATQWA